MYISRLCTGMNKLVVNNLEKLFITNDAGTIMQEVEIEHPAARLIMMAAQQQQREYGDCSNLVVQLTAELLLGAEDLIRIGIKPALIVEGYEMAYKKTLEIIKSDILRRDSIDLKKEICGEMNVLPLLVKSVIGAKQCGYEDLLTTLVLDAVKIAYQSAGNEAFEPDTVRCVKILGGEPTMSLVIPGLVIEREPFGHVHHIPSKAKIGIFACPLDVSRTETKGTVLITGASDLLGFSRGEEDILREQIEAIAAAGVNVVVTGETIGELALHFIERAGMMALKVPSKFELRRLCKAIGATPLARLGAPTEEEAGFADIVEVMEIGGSRCTVFRQTEANQARSRLATIILRSNTQSVLDDVERALDDALHTLRTATRPGGDARCCSGAGATEIELARLLSAYADITPGVAQYAIRKYAEAFELVPRMLATNAGHSPTELIAKLYWAHNSGDGQQAGAQHVSFDLDSGVLDQTRILDLMVTKRSAIHLATETALTILRVDQIIMSKPVGGPKPRPAGPVDPDDD